MSDEPNEFIQSLPETYRDDPVFEPYKDMDGLLKSHKELSKMMGKPRVDLPQDSWGEEDYNKFYTKLGRPEEASGYTQDLELPEGVELDEETAKWASDLLHKHGVSGKAGKEVIKAYINRQVEQDKAKAAELDQTAAETEKALRADWGDDYETNMELVKGVAQKFGDESFLELLNSPELGNNPALVRFIAKVGEEFREDVASGSAGAPPVSRQARARMELDQMKTDPSKSRLLNTPEHMLDEGEQITRRSLLAERSNLYRLAYPD